MTASSGRKAKALIGLYVLLLPLFLYPPASLRLEAPLYDWQVRWHAPTTATGIDPRIAIIDIDETSLTQEGRWPWPRHRISELLNQLDTLSPALVASDILFPDYSSSADDHILAQTLIRTGVTTTLTWSRSPQALPNHPIQLPALCENCETLPQIQGWIANTPVLQATEQAHITPIIAADGHIRRIYPLACRQAQCVEMLALSLARQLYLQPSEYKIEHTFSGMTLNNSPMGLHLPLEFDGSMLIPWYSRSGDIEYVSATDVLQGRVATDSLSGRILIIGSSALGLYDQINTPLYNNYPAVEAHARLLQAILDQHWWQRPVSGLLAALLFSAIGLTLLWFLDHRQRPRLLWMGAVLILAVWWFLATTQFPQGHVWPLAAPALSIILASILLTPWSLLDSIRSRDILRRQFSNYVPEAVVERILHTPNQAIGIAPERHHISILFADLRAFSRYAETMEPEQLSMTMQHLMDQFTEVIYRHGGTVDKYMGDCIMAFWGAPLHDSQHAQHAVEAACALCHTMHAIAQQPGMPQLELSVGINSGEVIVGDFGSSRRRSYTVMGAPVNLAAHLEAATRKCDVAILAGDSTRQLAPHFPWQPAQQLNLGNRTRSTTAWPLDPFTC